MFIDRGLAFVEIWSGRYASQTNMRVDEIT